MNATVIPFPSKSASQGAKSTARPTAASERFLSSELEIALFVHTTIVQRLRSGDLEYHPEGPYVAINDILTEIFGADFLPAAERDFENLYGVDPYIFLEELMARM